MVQLVYLALMEPVPVPAYLSRMDFINPMRRYKDRFEDKRREHSVTNRREHSVTNRREHSVTNSREHSVTNRREHSVTNRREHSVTNRREHAVTNRRKYSVTNRREHSVTSFAQSISKSTRLHDCGHPECKRHGTCKEIKSGSKWTHMFTSKGKTKRNGFSCKCQDGYGGDQCGELNKCANLPCEHGGTCKHDKNPSTNFNCYCVLGYSGKLCEKCDPAYCSGHGTCSIKDGQVRCECTTPGFTGKRCTVNKFQCGDIACNPENTERCFPSQHCKCKPGYYGTTCGDYYCSDNEICSGFNVCKPTDGGFHCDCPAGYTGQKCESRVCDGKPCGRHGVCVVDSKQPTGYKCQCEPGFAGIFDCQTSVCDNFQCNGGKCLIIRGQPRCSHCPNSMQGPHCDIPICTQNSCQNSGTCSVNKNNRGFTCSCSPNWKGSKCETLICPKDYCDGHGTCTPTNGTPICKCEPGRFGPRCTVSICDGFNCNGFPCHADKSGKASCQCPAYKKGSGCELDACDGVRCGNGVCKADSNGVGCQCRPGYFGTTCQTSECDNKTCDNSGSCVIEGGKPVCKCPKPWTGDLCQKVVDQCVTFANDPCQNGGSCVGNSTHFQCNCAPNYKGDNCTIADLCLTTRCNTGKCSSTSNTFYTCDCAGTRHKGVNCDIPCDECTALDGTGRKSISPDCTTWIGNGGEHGQCPPFTILDTDKCACVYKLMTTCRSVTC